MNLWEVKVGKASGKPWTICLMMFLKLLMPNGVISETLPACMQKLFLRLIILMQ